MRLVAWEQSYKFPYIILINIRSFICWKDTDSMQIENTSY